MVSKKFKPGQRVYWEDDEKNYGAVLTRAQAEREDKKRLSSGIFSGSMERVAVWAAWDDSGIGWMPEYKVFLATGSPAGSIYISKKDLRAAFKKAHAKARKDYEKGIGRLNTRGAPSTLKHLEKELFG